MKHKQIICVDFDGVVHSYVNGWQGMGGVEDPPIKGAIQWLDKLSRCEEFEVAIFSSRNKSFFGRRAMKRWLAQHYGEVMAIYPAFGDDPDEPHDECWDFVRRLKFPWFKPAAHMFIDDRAMRFEGRFPSVNQIRNFKPWKPVYKQLEVGK